MSFWSIMLKSGMECFKCFCFAKYWIPFVKVLVSFFQGI